LIITNHPVSSKAHKSCQMRYFEHVYNAKRGCGWMTTIFETMLMEIVASE